MIQARTLADALALAAPAPTSEAPSAVVVPFRPRRRFEGASTFAIVAGARG